MIRYNDLWWIAEDPSRSPLTWPVDWPAIYYLMEFVRLLHEPSERSRAAMHAAMHRAFSRPL